MAVRILWDKYEVAYLLKACIDVENGLITRADAVSAVSKHLRQRAINRGEKIDDIFRNENGINMQFAALSNCYHGKQSGLTISKLFRDIVSLYKSDRGSFNQILEKEAMHVNVATWQDFLTKLKLSHGEKNVNEIVSLLNMVSLFARKKGLIQSPLSDITEADKIQQLYETLKKPGTLGIQSKKTGRSAIRALGVYLQYIEASACNKAVDSISSDPKVDSDEIDKDAPADPQVDFYDNRSYAHTKPTSCNYLNKEVTCNGWNALYISLIREIYHNHKDSFPIGKNVTTGNRIDTGHPDEMIYPKLIVDGIYLECNVSATGVVHKIRAFMELCGISKDDIVIRYRPTKEPSSSEHLVPKQVDVWNPCYQKQVETIITKYYSYGFRTGSPIEMMRFRNFAARESIQLPDDDKLLMKEIRHIGIEINGMIHVYSQDELTYIVSLIEEAFSTGAKAIFISEFMDKYIEWFEGHRIVSDDMLKELLKKVCPHYSYSVNMIMNGEKRTEAEAIVSEIHRVSHARKVVTLNELVAQLPYIPSEKLAWNLSASDEFVWIREGAYFSMKQFVITDSEKTSISEYVSTECQTNGYASLSSIPLDSVAEQNYELSGNAIYNAVYLAVLRHGYHLNGKILTSGQKELDLAELLRGYCRERQICTVDELIDKSLELTGEPNRQQVFSVLYDCMIRTDADTFVADNCVVFDTERIDSILSNIIEHSFIAIRDITTFALFPTSGYPWNHYLLESFCYRYSEQYRLSVLNFNDKNAGMIYHRSLAHKYDELLCLAAARADVPLTLEHLGEYFFTNGYTAKRKYAHLMQIVDKASVLREEK